MNIEQIMADMTAIVDSAEGRSLTSDEVERYETLENQLSQAQRDQQVRQRQAAYTAPAPNDVQAFTASAGGGQSDHPLTYSGEAVQAVQDAINTRTARRVEANLSPEQLRQVTNATVGTGQLGSPRKWGSNPLTGPRILHVIGGVRRVDADAVAAEFPELTLPTAQAGASEGASLAEYDSSTAGSATLRRFGRFTDLNVEARFGTDARAIVAMHQLGIAKDLDGALISDVESAAGTAAAFDDPPQDVRKAIAQVLDATASMDPADLVILSHPDDANLLQDVQPTGGETTAEAFQRFAGALVYPSSAVTSGTMVVSNLRAGTLFFEAQGAMTAFDEDVKTGVRTVATALVGGYGVSLTDGFAQAVDVTA
ncbi:hypothetical protein GCM10009676_00530 [Prauserella halophila]|uniref:Phage major capsid protein n=1 Tax=Prauserella halophila TaxID=185641 RepID=A0ABP4GFG8_9PSEU|nr:hypothetical protein [Prauserella halophila]MCP2234603.1 hypothetical protein [Prauserella halophila]